jgi:two-component system sensor histidine kinase VicK
MLTRADYNFVVKYGEVTPDGVAVFDLNSRKFVYANRFLNQILGLAERETLDSGESVLKFVHPEDLAYAEDRYRELLSIGCVPPIEFRIMQPDGMVRYVSMEVLWLEDCYTFALFVRDLTALRKHEEFVVNISAQKDTLLDMLLHNLSGPLYLARDVLKLAQKQNAADSAHLVNILSDSTAHCIGIIQQFLQDEHTESTKVSVRRARFSLLDKTRMVVNLISELNKEKRISLSSDLEDNFITSDPVKFCQVVHNLLSNAVKYTTDTGVIDIRITGEKRLVRISITDDGIGVPAELRDRIFHERVKGTPGLKGEPSNGMGLFLCAQLALLIDGRLSYQNVETGGSTFSLEISRELVTF